MDERDRSPTPTEDSFSSVLNGILSNPEMLSMVSSMAEKLKGGMTEGEESAPQPEEALAVSRPAPDLSEAIGALGPLLSGASHTSGRDSNRDCLLRALKPYLSSGRGEAIEHIIKFSRITGILKNLS